MKQTENSVTPTAPAEDDFMGAIAEKQIHLSYALDVFQHVGEVLNGLPHQNRESSISIMRNEARNFGNQGELLASMMLIQLANAWEGFSK